MSTIKQQNLARLRLDNPQIEKKQLVELGGYSEAVQKTPSKALESKGYKEALRELGLTEEFITTALVNDIENKPKNRLGELRLGSEILGMTEHQNGGSKTLVLVISGESANRYNVTPTRDSKDSSS